MIPQVWPSQSNQTIFKALQYFSGPCMALASRCVNNIVFILISATLIYLLRPTYQQTNVKVLNFEGTFSRITTNVCHLREDLIL